MVRRGKQENLYRYIYMFNKRIAASFLLFISSYTMTTINHMANDSEKQHPNDFNFFIYTSVCVFALILFNII